MMNECLRPGCDPTCSTSDTNLEFVGGLMNMATSQLSDAAQQAALKNRSRKQQSRNSLQLYWSGGQDHYLRGYCKEMATSPGQPISEVKRS